MLIKSVKNYARVLNKIRDSVSSFIQHVGIRPYQRFTIKKRPLKPLELLYLIF